MTGALRTILLDPRISARDPLQKSTGLANLITNHDLKAFFRDDLDESQP